MYGNTVYLEAPELTQDLLNIKWALRSAGYDIGSSWHERGASKSSSASKDHWTARGLEQLQTCDLLVVVCGKSDRARSELAMMAGFALARGVRVIWIGSPVQSMSDFRAVQQFNTAEDFRRQVLEQMYSRSIPTDERLAA
jgi:hypothetical protein